MYIYREKRQKAVISPAFVLGLDCAMMPRGRRRWRRRRRWWRRRRRAVAAYRESRRNLVADQLHSRVLTRTQRLELLDREVLKREAQELLLRRR